MPTTIQADRSTSRSVPCVEALGWRGKGDSSSDVDPSDLVGDDEIVRRHWIQPQHSPPDSSAESTAAQQAQARSWAARPPVAPRQFAAAAAFGGAVATEMEMILTPGVRSAQARKREREREDRQPETETRSSERERTQTARAVEEGWHCMRARADII